MENPTFKNKEDLNEVLISWVSASHPFKKRDRIFYQTVAAITFLLVVIVFLIHEFMLVGVILSIAFVVYVISTIPPVDVEHKVTPIGFDSAGRLYHWFELSSFWFEDKWNYKILVLHTRLAFPGQVRVVVLKEQEQLIKEVLSKFLLFLEKPPKNFVDSFSSWLARKIPLEIGV